MAEQGAQQLPGVRRARQAGGALRQDPPVRLRHGQRALPGSARDRAGRQGRRRRQPVRPHRPVDLLRPALSRAVPRHGRRRHHRGAVGLHRDHRQGALGNPDPRARHREPGLRGGPGAGRLPPVRPRNPRRQHDRRPVGRGARPPAARLRRGRRRHQPGLPGQPAQEPAGAQAPLHPVSADRSRRGRARVRSAKRVSTPTISTAFRTSP